MKPVRWLYVNARVIVRWIVRRLTGRWATVPISINREQFYREMVARMFDQQRFLIEREKDNRSLLTGMTAALIAGSRPWMTGWQQYKFAAQRRSYAKGMPQRVVGKPVVLKHSGPNRVKIGMTNWTDDYVSREERRGAK